MGYFSRRRIRNIGLTMMALAAPMVLLFAVAELVMYLREKRLPKEDDFAGLSDDEASPLDLSATDTDIDK